ncbi:hypothetical protein AJ79_02078 [Helicocarpus griseus UAMH5409]|uniref:Rhodopsin domain-containing protein n=1 Tax=Helicocarpus griseus UAMH5409 TaxID=1447875 RepID=A0A2B7Y4D6_9EURO|nr:hypothetical protein AJ79_02078 [Helicocarpus griseus UAMH5409]
MKPFGDPPPGIDLSVNRTRTNNAAVATTYGLAVIAVALRFYTRMRMQHVAIKADDWVILVSLRPNPISCSETNRLVAGGYHGLGRHVWAVPLGEVMVLIEILFAYMLIYIVTVPLIKFSILLFYRRLFGMNKAIWICFFLSAGYWISCTIALVACCRPPSYFWTQIVDQSAGRCVFDPYTFYIGNAGANVITDALIFLIPIPLIWKLRMRTGRKLIVCGIFLLGGFVCVVSIVRIHLMTSLARSIDITYILSDVFIWSTVEPCIGIVCACLPSLQPLFQCIIRTVFGSSIGNIFATSRNFSSDFVRPREDDNDEKKVTFKLKRGKDEHEPKRKVARVRFRPSDDTAVLTTTSEHVEMDDLRIDDSGDCDDGNNTDFTSPMSIRVKMDFDWREDHHQ